MRKLLSYLSYIGIPFISVCSSYAQYPDAKSLLGRLGIEIDKDRKPVAYGTGGWLPLAYAALLARSTTEELTQLFGNEIALKENRWNNHCISHTYSDTYNKFYLVGEEGIIPNEADLGRIGDLVRSREFLAWVFGKDFVSEFLKTAESSGMVYTELVSCIDFQEYRCLRQKLELLEMDEEDSIVDKKDSIVDKLWEVRGKMDEEDSIVDKKDSIVDKKDSIVDKLWKVRGKMDKKDSIVDKKDSSVDEEVDNNYSLCAGVYLERQKEIKSQIAECKTLLGEKRYKSLREKLSVFDEISYNSDQNEVLLAKEDFLKELGRVSDLQSDEHPVRIALSKVQALLPGYLESCSRFKEAVGKKRENLRKEREALRKKRENLGKKWEKEKEKEKEKVRNEIKELFEEYRKRFGGTIALHGQLFPTSTEPVTVDIWIYQYHFKDANGERKLYTEKWKERLVDLNIKLRLTIDTRTRKLLSAFCREEFIVNGQIITNFGTNGLCIFEGE